MTKHGIFTDLNIDDYHKSDGISSSGINLILESPKKYHYRYLSGLYKPKDSKALTFGNAIHTLALEPKTFAERFVMLDEGFTLHSNSNKKIYKDIIESGKTPLKQNDFKEISNIAYSLNHFDGFRRLFDASYSCEVSLFWNSEQGVQLRARPDFFNDYLIVDLKTTESILYDDWQRSIVKNGYHIQAAMQIDGMAILTGKNLTFCHVAIEKEPPYEVAMYALDEESINIGRELYKKGALLYKQCKEVDYWPSINETIQLISLPDFYVSNYNKTKEC